MSNSSLVNYTLISPHKNKRTKKITKITWHHMAGKLSVKSCGQVFQTRQASTNYGVSGKDVGLYVPEDYRAWSTANPENDHQAINMELANDGGAPEWHVADETIETAIQLTVDCCRRNGIKELIYTGDASGNFTTHDMFMATTCPGPYLKSKMTWAAAEINKRLKGEANADPEVKHLYRVRKTWADAESQLGAFEVLENAKKLADKNPGYEVYDENGKAIYPEAAAPAAGSAKYTNVQLACQVWVGKWGNGAARKTNLEAAGYNYEEVQALVEKGVGNKKTATNKALAEEVLQGLWGNGADRKNRLTAAGFDYHAVQAEVNKLV